MKLNRVVALLWLALFAASLLAAQDEIPVLQQRVTDFTNSLSFAEWRALESKLKQFEDSTSTQISVLFIKSLEGGAIEDYSIRVFEKNEIGQKGKDNGVLIVVAKDDRLVRIEVGYGLEGALTDALSSQITRREILPRFKEGNFYGGISAGVDAIMAATAGEYQSGGEQAPFIASALLLFAMIFLFVFFVPMLASRRRAVIGGSTWSYHSGWGSISGGRGGGSFGGFSGGGWSGGGGMGGGGGATGSW